jgi:hypothetical protein
MLDIQILSWDRHKNVTGKTIYILTVFYEGNITYTVELVKSDTQVFRHPVTSDKNLWSQSTCISVN